MKVFSRLVAITCALVLLWGLASWRDVTAHNCNPAASGQTATWNMFTVLGGGK